MKTINKKLKPLIRAWMTVKHWVKKRPWTSFLLATAPLTIAIHFYIALFVPPTREKVWTKIEVTEGMSFKAIASALQREGIIRYRGYFEIIGRLEGITRNVRVGDYGLGSHMSMWEVLGALRTGKIIEYEVVVPEGYNLYQIGYTLSGTPLISDPRQFISLAGKKPPRAPRPAARSPPAACVPPPTAARAGYGLAGARCPARTALAPGPGQSNGRPTHSDARVPAGAPAPNRKEQRR